MNYKDKELIIFDFDGTLIDSVPDLTLAVNILLAHYDLKPVTLEEVTPFIGNGVKILVERALKYALPAEKVTKELFEEALDIYFKAYKDNLCVDTYLYPGVMNTLKYLYNKGYTLAICTNKPMEFIEPILDELSIKQFFKYWIGGDSLAEKKPDAAPLLHIAAKMNKDVEKCLMVGDSRNDIDAAKNAGMESIGVSYGYNYNEHISDYGPTKVVDKFAELQSLF